MIKGVFCMVMVLLLGLFSVLEIRRWWHMGEKQRKDSGIQEFYKSSRHSIR
jgi:hypothetical protein